MQGYILAQSGKVDQAERVIQKLEAKSVNGFVPPYAKALIYAGLTRPNLAMDYLERAFDVHDVHLNFLLVDPKWDSFQKDAPFRELIARCGFRGQST